MDDTPSYISSPEQKPSKKKTIWLMIIILALIASNVAWALFYIKQQGELNTTITTLNARNAKLAKDNKSLQAASESSDSNSDYREIPELGVKYKITDENKDLTYSYGVTSGSVGSGLETINIAFKSTFKLPVQSPESGDYENFPYAVSVVKYPADRLKDFANVATGDLQKYQKDHPGYIKKVGNDTYIISERDGRSDSPRSKDAVSKQKVVESTLQSLKAIE